MVRRSAILGRVLESIAVKDYEVTSSSWSMSLGKSCHCRHALFLVLRDNDTEPVQIANNYSLQTWMIILPFPIDSIS